MSVEVGFTIAVAVLVAGGWALVGVLAYLKARDRGQGHKADRYHTV